MAIQIGKYKRPGIFIEEFDNSIITTPVVEGITNMVIGVSKKGPVNTPIRLTTLNDLENIFGPLDRGLERKGSFFHRTIQKMLESSPVFAINLLKTNDTLDLIEYKSISASTGYMNDIEREGPYRRFFDTTGFWKRDTESFINLTKSNTGYSERAFSFTNMSDKYISVFVFKSARTGFDRTLIEWYGSQEKVPPYVNSKDYASDYLVDVVVVSGDWSNYRDLSIDTRWSNYFNASGLIKEQVRAFANDRNVTLLGYYEGLSLIPYFRDLNGTNIFIETVINRNTDKTGLFCAFNADLVETDYYNGMLDLIGQTIAGQNETNIEYLSYKETVAESIVYTNTPLDLPGNVTAMLGVTMSSGTYSYNDQKDHFFGSTPKTSGVYDQYQYRTAWFAEGYTYDVYRETNNVITNSTTASINIRFGLISPDAYAVIGDQQVPVSLTASFAIKSSQYPVSGATLSYASVFRLDSTGTMSVVNNLTGDATSPTFPSVNASDIVLGYMTFSVINGFFATSSISYSDVTVGTTTNTHGLNDFMFGTSSTHDFYIATQSTAGQIKVEFMNTNTVTTTSNYKAYRRVKQFNRIVDLIDSSNKEKMVINLGPTNGYRKVSMKDMTISNIVTSSTQNKSFVLDTGLSNSELQDIVNGYFVIYTLDNEFIMGEDSVKTKEAVATTSEGVAGEYSKFYTRFFDGSMNTGDYFYNNLVPQNLITNETGFDKVIFIDGEDGTNGNSGAMSATSSYAGYNFIIFNTANDPAYGIYQKLIVPSSTLNKGTFTITSNDSYNLAQALGYGTGYWAYQVNEEVVYEELDNVLTIYDAGDTGQHYLKMYLDGSGVLEASFWSDSDFTGNSPVVDPIQNNTFYVQSAKSNFKQTIEIELPTGYVEVPNKILVSADRYTEVRVGDFLSAYYDPTALVAGEAPRKLTRILSKKQYSGDTSLVEITCDSRIEKLYSGSSYQATRYTIMENYVSTYNAISLKGFRIRQASLPDGTEERQNEILNLVAKGTPLFKAATNKEAIDFRYLVDSFGLGLTERSKQQLVDICGYRLDALGFINMPSMKSFKNSSSPSFMDNDITSPTYGSLRLDYVAAGGDLNSSPAFLYSFGDGPGSTSVGYFMPYLTVNDNGRPTDIPPSAWVATTYMRKQNSNVSGITPWTIAAGVTNGRITNIVKTEMDFTPTDIEYINQAQMNPIVFKRNRGNIIETENTAQTLYKSALSYLHVREVLIELERELSRMLLDYQWKFNTPDVRAEIKLRADVICETYVSKSGLYNYFNKMDEENNTSEIIDNQIGVLDTYVEPIKGMGIIVNNITILRTGAIDAGGFITA